jgi:hypothetical protein
MTPAEKIGTAAVALGVEAVTAPTHWALLAEGGEWSGRWFEVRGHAETRHAALAALAKYTESPGERNTGMPNRLSLVPMMPDGTCGEGEVIWEWEEYSLGSVFPGMIGWRWARVGEP